MAFSLGSIFVNLTCNTAQFLTGMEKGSVAARKLGKDVRAGTGEVSTALAALGPVGQQAGSVLEMVGNRAGDAFDVAAKKGRGLGTLLSGALLGGVTAVAGGLFGLAESAADVGSKIFESSEKTGIAAGQMSGLMALTKETGGNFDGLTTSLARAGANLEKAIIAPGSQSARILAQVMGGAKQLSDVGLLPMGDRLQTVMQHIFALNDVGERNTALNALLGRGWTENISTLKLLAQQGYAPAIAKAHDFGIYFDDAHAAQARQMQIALDELAGNFKRIGLAIGQWAIPLIHGMTIGMQGMSAQWERFTKLCGAGVALLAGDLRAARDLWNESKQAADRAGQAQTDFLVHLDSVTRSEKTAGDEETHLTGTVKKHREELDHLTAAQRRQNAELERFRELLATSQTLAEWGHGAPSTPPGLNIPALGPMPAALGGVSLPGAPPSAAVPSSLELNFRNALTAMSQEGDAFTGKLSNAFITLADNWEGALAHMVVTGKANFRQILGGFEESVLKAGMQKGTSMLLGALGIHGGGAKPDGTQGNPLYVKSADRVGGILGGAGGGEGGGEGEEGQGTSTFSNMVGGLKNVAGSAWSALSSIGSFFGGFLAEGGSVDPHHAYIVGEKHPEFFVPRASGAVVPSLSTQQLRPLNFTANYHINTPNADSFRRSQAQTIADAYRTMVVTHGRNS
jgi:hypothetical protein